MGKVLFDNGAHKCIVFDDVMRGAGLKGGDIQSNQFLILHRDRSEYEEGLLYDPGGSKLIQTLHRKLMEHTSANRIKKIVLSHQDPDAGAGVTYWMMLSNTNTKIYVSSLWVRFIPHFSRNDFAENVFVPVPDQGMRINHNGAEVILVPAHFLHSPGNFQLYDTVSNILFSGDLGTAIVPDEKNYSEVADFESHIKYMEGFHKRYIASEKACRLWAQMVRKLDIEAIVPQHGGRYFKGKKMVNKFIDWVENLRCGVDLINPESFAIPK